MIFSQSVIGNSRAGAEQWNAVSESRIMANAQEELHLATIQRTGLQVNAGLIPQDVYQEFDRVSVEQFREDEGDTFLNDLLPLSRPVSIGKLVHKFRQVSDAGSAQTSMTGQIGVLMDQVEYSYDGSIIPIHDTGFYRNWREWNAQTSEGFDALIDDQRESVRTLRSHIADNFMNGHLDKDGNAIVVDGISWAGMTADSRVAAIDLGAGGLNFDFTDTTKTGAEIKAAFIQIRDTMWITNKCSLDLTVYVSKAIASNFERKFSTSYDSKIIMQELADLMGIAAIKTTSKLVGNKLMGFPLTGNAVRPIVGMGINTVAMPRPVYNSNYQFAVWGAVGFEVRTDYDGLTCAFYATA